MILRSSLVLIVAVALSAGFADASTHKKSHSAPHSSSRHSATTTSSGSHSSHASAKSTSESTSAASQSSSDSSTTTSSKNRRHKTAAPAKTRLHGQQAIAPERVTEIQQALIREHYLDKEADGVWDSQTIAAMQKFQAAQGWQTKLMPDSRALMKLGLGPDYSNAINAKTGNFAPTTLPSTLTQEQSAGFTAGSGVTTR